MTARNPAQVHERALTILRVLAAALVAAALVVLGAALLPDLSAGLLLLSVGLLLAAATAWRIGHRLGTDFDESRAWTEVALLHETMAHGEAMWSALPAPAAAWDSQGRSLMATAAWQSLGLAADAPPRQLELSVGDPPRVFVVEHSRQPAGTHLVLLREVSRERQALQAKDELLAIVGHELRTPLTAIKGYGQLMARQLATVQEQVQRLDGLIGDVLDTAHAEGGKLALRREPLSVSDLVEAACERFGAAHPSRRVDKALEARALIEADPGRLNQVIDNLLSNAAKYSPADTPISVRTSMDGEFVRLAVSDRGVGIAAEHLPRLFDRFYRVPVNDAAAPAGFGLGLSIVRDLVEAHGGRVDVASNGPGKGCTFTVVLPVTLPLERNIEAEPPVLHVVL